MSPMMMLFAIAIGQSEFGQLATTLRAVNLYVKPDSHVAVAYQVAKGRRLVVTSDQNSWTGVLLSDGSVGYIPSSAVRTEEQRYRIKRVPNAAGRTGRLVATIAQMWVGKDIPAHDLVSTIYRALAVKLPAQPADQVLVGHTVDRLEQLQPGDRLYFWRPRVDHIDRDGIYVGEGYFVHASPAKREVIREYLGNSKWLKELVAARR